MHVNATLETHSTELNLTTNSSSGVIELPLWRESFDITTRRQMGWVFLIIFFLATFGNIVIILVMNKPRNKVSVSSTFFTALAVSDLFQGGHACVGKFFTNVLQLNAVSSSDPSPWAALNVALSYANAQISTWILVAVTIERLLCILLPHKVKSLCTQFIARAVIGTLIVILMGFNLVAHYVMIDVMFPGSFRPVFVPKFHDAHTIFMIIEMFIGFAIPFVITSISSIIIVCSLYRISGSEASTSRANSATRNIILANIVFIITYSPMRVYYLMLIVEKVPYTQEVDLISHICMALVDSNAAANFFVYCLGSPRFREDVKELFGIRSSSDASST